MCIASHVSHEACVFGIALGCRALAAGCIGGSLAGGSWFAELAAEPVHPRELPGLSVGRAASKLCPVRSRERSACCRLVPEELVPEVQRSLDNGRALQDLLHQAAPRYIKALKRERAGATKIDKG